MCKNIIKEKACQEANFQERTKGMKRMCMPISWIEFTLFESELCSSNSSDFLDKLVR